ncbi:dihydrofolate reductase [Salinibacterium sp. CAN_S4]|uniref:dihydrofolate reductase family protein n=1 Tax=Salinibacterium sp. CAN_S4 TaxID=2787727 RepID=UPI0018EFA7AA
MSGAVIYTGIISLDGYTNDADGHFDWSAPDEEVHGFINDLERNVGTYLLGRRMFEVMNVWDTMPIDPEHPVIDDYAEIWRAADKIVYSTTLTEVTSPRTRLERNFDPEAVRAIPGTVSVGGATLAAEAIRAGIVDEYRMLVNPVIVGGGTPYFPLGVALELDLQEQRSFANGVVYLRYRPR